ncbi:MAG: hypothetical protein FJ096_18815 [Deltaproteobacteria bacterium]|nr:hypothetical protein [Deltaproteobacteria bacterium]
MSKRNVQLTSETVVPASRRHVAVTVVTALLSVLAVNVGALAFVRNVPLNRGYWLVEQKWAKLEDSREAADWLFLGDSSCNQGLRPDVWKQATGEDAQNLCTIGEMIVTGDAWMLERHVERHGPPRKGAVLVHVYDVWHRPASPALRGSLLAHVPLPWGFWERLSPPLGLNPVERLGVAAGKYAPLYADNASLAVVALRGVAFEPPRFALDGSGYMAWHKANPEAVRADVEQHVNFVNNVRFKASAENRDALARIRALAEQHRFHVYVATSPIAEQLPRLATWRRYKASIDAWQRKVVEGSTYVHLVQRTPVTFRPEEMENADHLTHEAAARYTTTLAKSVLEARTKLAPAPDVTEASTSE